MHSDLQVFWTPETCPTMEAIIYVVHLFWYFLLFFGFHSLEIIMTFWPDLTPSWRETWKYIIEAECEFRKSHQKLHIIFFSLYRITCSSFVGNPWFTSALKKLILLGLSFQNNPSTVRKVNWKILIIPFPL